MIIDPIPISNQYQYDAEWKREKYTITEKTQEFKALSLTYSHSINCFTLVIFYASDI